MKIKECLYPFVQTPQGICPFCKIPLSEGGTDGGTDLIYYNKYCPKGTGKVYNLFGENGPYCPFFFEIFAFQQDEYYDKIEVTLHEAECRVWIGEWEGSVPKVITVGAIKYTTCVLFPIEKTNFSDMDKFTNKIKTILTFQ